MYLASKFLFDFEMNGFCYMFFLVLLMTSRVTTMMVTPLAVYRVVSILCPHSYKKIIAKKKITIMIIVLWISAVFAVVLLAFNSHLAFVSSLAIGAVIKINPISLLIFVVPEVMSIALLLFASGYLHYKIIKSNQFIHNVQMLQIGRKL